jgi:transmembrane sensor
MSPAADIEDRAAAWLLRREEPGWSDADQAQLDAWLDASPLHRVALYRLEYGWRKADRLAALQAPAEPARAWQFPRLRQWGAPLLAVVIVAAAVGGGVMLFGGGRSVTRAYATEIGGRASFPLEDGSRVELNTDTRLRTELSEHARAAWLDQGEAYFDVAQDVGRPFMVHVGSRLVAVLGTKFSIRRDGDRVKVAVLEGRVQVYAKPDSGTIAAPGDIVIIQGDTARVEHASLDSIAGALGWREGHLTFDQATLADAAREFNRYNRKKLVIDATAAAVVHIGGTFDAENVDAFARLLAQAYGLKVADDGARIVISGSKRAR